MILWKKWQWEKQITEKGDFVLPVKSSVFLGPYDFRSDSPDGKSTLIKISPFSQLSLWSANVLKLNLQESFWLWIFNFGFVVWKNLFWLSWLFFFFSEQKDDETTEQTWLMFYMLSMKVRMYTWIFRRKTPRTRNKHDMWSDQ